MRVPVSSMLKYSSDGNIYRSFDNIIVVMSGLVIAIPITLITGNLKSVQPYCPVPWEEMWAILDTESTKVGRFSEDLFAKIHEIFKHLVIADDVFNIAELPEYKATVFMHDSGIRVGISNDLLFKD